MIHLYYTTILFVAFYTYNTTKLGRRWSFCVDFIILKEEETTPATIFLNYYHCR